MGINLSVYDYCTDRDGAIRNNPWPEEEDAISYFRNEKLHLVKILDTLNQDLKRANYIDLKNVYIEYLKNETISQRKVKEDLSNCALICMFYIIAPILTVFNLIGIFQIKSILDELFNILKNVVVMYFTFEFDQSGEDRENNNNTTDYSSNYTNYTNNFDNNTYNFYKTLYDQTYDRTVNFDLIMMMNFIGFMTLKSCGFSVSTVIFLIINILALLMTYNFDFDSYDDKTKKFSFFKILYLLGCFILLYIGVGASTLLSQQILVDSYNKLDERKNPERKKAFLEKIKKIQEMMLEDKTQKEEEKKEEKKEELIEENIINDSNEDEKEENIINNSDEKEKDEIYNINFKEKKSQMDSFFIVCLTTVLGYFGKYYLDIFLLVYEINKEEKKNYQKYFFYIVLIYSISIISSLFLYLIFKTIFVNDKKDKEKKNEYNIYQICGYTIYTQNEILRRKSIPKCECCKLCCNTFDNCCEAVLCNYCRREDCCECLCCLLNRCCGCSCSGDCDLCRSYDVDYSQNEAFFCYCYQGRRKFYWMYEYLTSSFQRELTPKLFIYFSIQLLTIGFESLFNMDNEKLKEKHVFEVKEIIIMAIIFILSFIAFLCICISYGKINLLWKESESELSEKIAKDIKELSNQIVDGMYGVLVFNAIYSLVLSSRYLSLDDKSSFIDDYYYYLYIPILMSKFFYFSLTYYSISKSEETKGFELISGSISVSIYLLIWNLIVSIMTTYIPEKVLFILHILFSSIICFVILIVILCFGICSCKIFWTIIFLTICCGGLFFQKEEEAGRCCSLYCDGIDLRCICCGSRCCKCDICDDD